MTVERKPIAGTPSFEDPRFAQINNDAFGDDPNVQKHFRQERQSAQLDAETPIAFGSSEAVQSIVALLAARKAAEQAAIAPVDPYKRDRAKLRAPLE